MNGETGPPRWLLLTVLSLLSLVVRLHGIARRDLWYDEVVTLIDSQGVVPPTVEPGTSLRTGDLRLRQGLSAVAKHSATHDQPIYVSVVYLWTRVIDPSETSLRLPSALAGAATVPLVAFIGWRLLGFWPGNLAACLLALSPLHVRYSQEARTYALSTLAVVFVVLAALTLEMRRSRFTYGWFGLTVGLVPALHLLAATAVIPSVFWAASRRERWRGLLLAFFTAGGLWLSLVPLGFLASLATAHRESGLGFRLHSEVLDWPPAASALTIARGVGSTVIRLLGIEYFPLGIQGRTVAPLGGALLLLASAAGASLSGRARTLLVGGAVVPLATAVGLAIGYGHIATLQDRYTAWSIPFLALLLAHGACRMRRGLAQLVACSLLLLWSVFLVAQQVAPAPRECLRATEARRLADCSRQDGSILIVDSRQAAVLAAWEHRPLLLMTEPPAGGLCSTPGYVVEPGFICVVGRRAPCSKLWKLCPACQRGRP